MAGNGNGKAPVFVVVQLTGGNDFMNTVILTTARSITITGPWSASLRARLCR